MSEEPGGPRPRSRIRRLRRLLFGLGLLALLGSVPFAVARLDGGGGAIHPLEVRLAALTPVGGLLALAALVCAVLAGPRRWSARLLGLVAAALVVLHVAWQLPVLRGGGTALEPDGPRVELRVLALNAHGTADPAQIVAAVRAERVDVLALSETGEEHHRRLQAAGLDALLPYTSDHVREGVRAVGTDSTVVRSRYPLTVLPAVPVSEYTLPRVRIQVPEGPAVTVVAVHLASPRPGTTAAWQADLARIDRLQQELPETSVLAGDYNATHDHRGFRALLGGRYVDAAEVIGRRAWPGLTWPAGRRYGPAGRLDHVLFTRADIGVRSVRTLAFDATDHRGVLADLVMARSGS